MKRLLVSILLIGIIIFMNNLNAPTDGTISDNFATIPDVSVLAESNRVTSSEVAFGLTRGDVFKVVQSNTVPFSYSFTAKTVGAGSELSPTPSLPIAHNLGFVPSVSLAYTDPTGSVLSPFSNGSLYDYNFSSNDQESIYWQVTIDKTNIYISLLQLYSVSSGTLNAQSGTVNIVYDILQKTRN